MNGIVRPGDLVRLRGRTRELPIGTTATVLEVFKDPKAPLAYVGFADGPRYWIFASNLEVVAAADDGGELRPPA